MNSLTPSCNWVNEFVNVNEFINVNEFVLFPNCYDFGKTNLELVSKGANIH